MIVEKISISGVRNIRSAEFSPHRKFNLIVGSNGAGKTSLLEAIYLLSRGRSFRTRSVEGVISDGSDHLLARAELSSDGGERHTSAIKRGVGEVRPLIKMDGVEVKSAAELSETMPLLLLDTNSAELVTDGPMPRRQNLDWGVFHVEHSFFPAWKTYRRALEQRNSLLRRGKIHSQEYSVWEAAMSSTARQINALRESYLDQLNPLFGAALDQLDAGLSSVRLGYNPGWEIGEDFVEQITARFDRDLKNRSTSIGPHRADVPFLLEGKEAAQKLSRGQTKLAVYALKLAQGQLYNKHKQQSCIYLLDDMAAELDEQHQTSVIEFLRQLPSQVFVTGVDVAASLLADKMKGDCRVFHVEHGELREKKQQ